MASFNCSWKWGVTIIPTLQIRKLRLGHMIGLLPEAEVEFGEAHWVTETLHNYVLHCRGMRTGMGLTSLSFQDVLVS